MFNRNIGDSLKKWALNSPRKPLIIRGARQVGKTTLVKQIAENYQQYIYLNLELAEDRQIFEQYNEVNSLIQAVFFAKNQLLELRSSTLLFIDEIQALPKAVQLLRYFYETAPDIAVIAAGSMLETLFDREISFPVGRVEYLVLRPVSFSEFLAAMHEQQALQQLKKIPLAGFAEEKIRHLFHEYALIGGMPEIVSNYAKNRDLVALSPIYEGLIVSYLEDVEKYATGNSQVLHLRHVIKTAFVLAGKRIKFEGFGNSVYKSREMGECLRILEKAMLLYLLYPSTNAVLPILPDIKKSPRLQILDTGLMNYFAGIQSAILGTKDLSETYQGIVIEHLVGQELLAAKYTALSSLSFWVRDKNNSSAEVDFIYPYQDKLIPIEVKSGATGKMKSLQIYMDLAPHDIAVRVYAGKLVINELETKQGKKFRLLNLPYFLVSQIDQYLDWMEE
jgi:uncharacterized protein